MNYKFSDKYSSFQSSAVGEILKATNSPNMIPLAAGNPAPDAFPVDEVRQITREIFDTEPIEALQYGVTEGYLPLRKCVSDWMKQRENIGREFDDITILSGSTQIMDITTRILCNEGDTVICEEPSFVGSLNCFRSYGCKLKGISMESDGINVDELEEYLKTPNNAKFIYTIPNFQNPAGATMSLEKRHKLYDLAKKYGLIILEDNPYGELRVEGDRLPCIKSFDDDGIVIYAGSFSKILSPGLRVAYCIAPKPLIAKITIGKQVSDVHTSVLNQMIVYKWLTEYDVDKHIEKIQDIYRKKLNLMCDCIDEELGDFVEYVRPQGGVFIWCKLPDYVDIKEFIKKTIKNNVAFVPGSAFLTDDTKECNYIRLNFSTPTDENIVKGIKILGEISKEY